jgi:hypothetical protein
MRKKMKRKVVANRTNGKNINPVFQNVTPVAYGLKLVITRKINLKKL